ncbi:MAG: hypothetical protein FH756_12280 [Firmicutes bacterium]|nr:hypothetical protein [Bacillota bacterium]
MKACCFIDESQMSGTKIRCSVNGKPVSNSDAQKILLRAATHMIVEKLRRLEQYAQKNETPGGLRK